MLGASFTAFAYQSFAPAQSPRSSSTSPLKRSQSTKVRLPNGLSAASALVGWPVFLVVVLIKVLGCPSGPTPGELHHLFPCPHHAFLVAESTERKHDVVVCGPVIRLQAHRFAI